MGNFYTQMNVCRIWRAYFWPFFKIAVPKRSLPAETSEGFFSRTLKTIFLRANNHRGSESDGYQDYPKTIEEGQYAHQKTLLQLCGWELPYAGRRSRKGTAFTEHKVTRIN